jgi:hypothetical protein
VSTHYEQVADEIYNRYTAAKKDAVTFTTGWLHTAYKNVTGGNNRPRSEARDHIAEALWEKYHLIVSYGDNAICVHPDRNFASG